MLYLILFVYSVIFVELFIRLNILGDANSVLSLSARSLEVVKSKEMSDREKEKFMRTNSLTMMLTTLKFVGKFIGIFIAIYLLQVAVEYYSNTLAAQVIESFTSIYLIGLITVATLLYVWIRNVISNKL